MSGRAYRGRKGRGRSDFRNSKQQHHQHHQQQEQQQQEHGSGGRRMESSAQGGGGRGEGGGGTYDELRQLLSSIEGRPYPAYHSLETLPKNRGGRGWVHPNGFHLYIGRTQSDPYAPPTRCQISIPNTANTTSSTTSWSSSSSSSLSLPWARNSNPIQRLATSDYLLRQLHVQSCHLQQQERDPSHHHSANAVVDGTTTTTRTSTHWSGPKGGDFHFLKPTQHVLEQSAVTIDDEEGNVTLLFSIHLPARGRSIMAAAAYRILDSLLSQLIDLVFHPDHLNLPDLQQHVHCVQDQFWLRSQLKQHNLVAFVRNGAILPRRSGADDQPLTQQPEAPVIPFQSPPSLMITFTLPYSQQTISGMGIPPGITLICGGGFHGKSTLLQTLQWGVYPKVRGDGREFCVTDPTAFKIRAEDGRALCAVDISQFIANLPFQQDTTCFSTGDASGSTSQAANIVEAMELGSKTLLVDEDTCATNFMIRDAKMMKLVANDKEPIKPFVHFVQSLHREHGISTIMVVGGLGDYFDVADHVLLMDCYSCQDVTDKAKEIAASSKDHAIPSQSFGPIRPRFPVPSLFQPNGKVKTLRKGIFLYGDVEVDLSSVEQVASVCQTSAIAYYLLQIAEYKGKASLREILDEMEAILDQEGLEALAPNQYHGGFSRPRILEVGAAMNRIRRSGAMQQLLL